ncbi:RidA family protein [Gluconobacter morbifer]|uniref:Uncharacterized protein n=1 Tax=Gluconobacter morbifer G707 TaxID=1088869 RepID=G6XJV7_9PROT|nr:hypothetical protein [Gluconobacter morbifer]EHH67919.1 hypothetical protein GMO_16860 [Gluconobacter morbifer G707]
MGISPTYETITRHGDEVICTDFSGLDPQGERPQRLSEECQAALDAIGRALAKHDLTLGHTRHVAAMLREGDAFGQCQAILDQALAASRPIMTLRIVKRFPLAGQRIALSVAASPHA